ncbi:MAG: AmmeMemoRadiSam system protein A [Mariprofundus sp.]|nr:AmmeMemoRadiSam system protein A [Mariprofundus sp.]
MSATTGSMLIALARQAIADHLGLHANETKTNATKTNAPKIFGTDGLDRHAATFVTLTRNGALRGCIGTLEAHRSLLKDVQANAVAAAFHDPRFPPVSAEEWPTLRTEISVLTAMQPLDALNEAEACKRIRPGIDGVLLQYHANKGTFLPQVWDQLPEATQFITHLKLKAGLPTDFWHPDVRLFTYQVDKYRQAKNE